MAPPRMRFTRQMLLLQIGLVTLVVAIGFAITGWLLNVHLIEQYKHRALSVAEAVASDPTVGDAVASGDPAHFVQGRAEAVRTATGAAFVVVTDRNGIRYAHTNPARLGQQVSTDFTEAVGGKKVSYLEHGTLGLSARGKVPLRDQTGAIVGEVSVGFYVDALYRHLWELLALATPLAAAALLLGVVGSVLLTRLLTRELDAVRSFTDTLRAQRHEFANRLHTLSGLLQIQHHQEAVEYLHALSGTPTVTRNTLGGADEIVRDPCLQAILSAKTVTAREKDVELEVGETSWVTGRVIAPLEVTTVVGNLVDNALEAARLGKRRPARVEIDLVAEGTTLHVAVADSGDGVPEQLRDSLFQEGVSTRDGDGRGLGLSLTRKAARKLGGDVRLTDAGGKDHGAVFVAHLPAVLEGGAAA